MGHVDRMKPMSATIHPPSDKCLLSLYLLSFLTKVETTKKNFFPDLKGAACQNHVNQYICGAYRGLLREYALISLQ